MKVSSISNHFNKNMSAIVKLGLFGDLVDMEFLPGNIGALLPNLENIQATSSNLSFLKRSNFRFMRKVHNVYASFNQISSIDKDSFHDLPSLRVLTLNNNKIKFLPPALLHKSKKLEFFHINDNQIEIIPKDFFINNKKLTNVKFSDNKLKTILVDFTKLEQLSELNLAGNVCINQKIGVYFGPLLNPTAVASVQAVINSNCTAAN